MNKEKYIAFSKTTKLPLQMQPWWLDIVCESATWNVCLSFDNEGGIVGALPYFLKNKFGVKIITMPQFTDYIGIWIKLPEGKRVSTYSNEMVVLNDLIEQLPKVTFFYQTYFPEFTNGLPFYWKGFTQKNYYTYIFEQPLNVDEIYQGLRYSVRTNIKKANKRVTVEKSDDLKAFYTVNTASFQRKGLKNPYSFSLLKNLDEVLQERNDSQVYLAKDIENNNIHAGLYMVWDTQKAYMLLTGIAPDLKNSAALYALYWEAIQDAVKMNLSIDFCGSILPEVEQPIRFFGAKRVPYFCISKTKNKSMKILSILLNKNFH